MVNKIKSLVEEERELKIQMGELYKAMGPKDGEKVNYHGDMYRMESIKFLRQMYTTLQETKKRLRGKHKKKRMPSNGMSLRKK